MDFKDNKVANAVSCLCPLGIRDLREGLRVRAMNMRTCPDYGRVSSSVLVNGQRDLEGIREAHVKDSRVADHSLPVLIKRASRAETKLPVACFFMLESVGDI